MFMSDVHVAGLKVAPDELAIFLHADGMVLFIPLKSDRYRIIADLGLPHAGRELIPPSKRCGRSLIDAWGVGP
jgi:hypothetical protein